MNSLERVMTTLRGDIPDRIPVVEVSIQDKIFHQIMPGASELDFYENFDIDGICVFYDLEFKEVAPNIRRDSFGILRNFKEMKGQFPTPLEPLIKADEDPMEFLENYKLPDPHDPSLMESLRKAVDRLKGKKAIIFIMHTNLIYPIYVRGFDNYMMDLYLRPEVVRKLDRIFTKWFLELEKEAIKIGADIILDGEDYAGRNGLWMSEEHLREFILPGLGEAIKVAKDANIPFVKHCDGNMLPIMDALMEYEIDCINPIEPQAGMDIKQVKKLYGDKICLWGNVDCSQLLPFGTTEQVREATIECIKNASKNGGYILASSSTIHEEVPVKNFITMVEIAREFGEYPIKL